MWATPLQAPLAAERAALLTGRDEDFTMVITMAYNGLRWGETTGLERDSVDSDEIHVEWQLREIRSGRYGPTGWSWPGRRGGVPELGWDRRRATRLNTSPNRGV